MEAAIKAVLDAFERVQGSLDSEAFMTVCETLADDFQTRADAARWEEE